MNYYLTINKCFDVVIDGLHFFHYKKSKRSQTNHQPFEEIHLADKLCLNLPSSGKYCMMYCMDVVKIFVSITDLHGAC